MRFQPESPHLVPWVTVTDFGCAKAGHGGMAGKVWSRMVQDDQFSGSVRPQILFMS